MPTTTFKVKSLPDVKSAHGYPQTDINRKGTMRKGKWESGEASGMKSQMKIRGTGAATKGTKFFPGD